MKKVKFSVACTAVYRSELTVDGNLTDEEILEEIHNRLEEAPIEDLQWISDWEPEEAVRMEDIFEVKELKI